MRVLTIVDGQFYAQISNGAGEITILFDWIKREKDRSMYALYTRYSEEQLILVGMVDLKLSIDLELAEKLIAAQELKNGARVN